MDLARQVTTVESTGARRFRLIWRRHVHAAANPRSTSLVLARGYANLVFRSPFETRIDQLSALLGPDLVGIA